MHLPFPQSKARSIASESIESERRLSVRKWSPSLRSYAAAFGRIEPDGSPLRRAPSTSLRIGSYPDFGLTNAKATLRALFCFYPKAAVSTTARCIVSQHRGSVPWSGRQAIRQS